MQIGVPTFYFCRPYPGLSLPCAERAADFLQAPAPPSLLTPSQPPRDSVMDEGPVEGQVQHAHTPAG